MAGKVGSSLVVTLQRTFAAPKDKVFEAWINPEAIRQWFSPHEDITIPSAEVDARVGGRYRFEAMSPDGSRSVVVGTYREVRPGERLVFTWSWEEGGMDIGETLVTVEFRGEGGETEVTLRHEQLPTDEARQAHSEGWTGILARLERFL